MSWLSGALAIRLHEPGCCLENMVTGSFFFFFSSRRRHTRLQGDWSSDVCSSDLALADGLAVAGQEDSDPAVDESDEQAVVRFFGESLALVVGHQDVEAVQLEVVIDDDDLVRRLVSLLQEPLPRRGRGAAAVVIHALDLDV